MKSESAARGHQMAALDPLRRVSLWFHVAALHTRASCRKGRLHTQPAWLEGGGAVGLRLRELTPSAGEERVLRGVWSTRSGRELPCLGLGAASDPRAGRRHLCVLQM